MVNLEPFIGDLVGSSLFLGPIRVTCKLKYSLPFLYSHKANYFMVVRRAWRFKGIPIGLKVNSARIFWLNYVSITFIKTLVKTNDFMTIVLHQSADTSRLLRTFVTNCLWLLQGKEVWTGYSIRWNFSRLDHWYTGRWDTAWEYPRTGYTWPLENISQQIRKYSTDMAAHY